MQGGQGGGERVRQASLSGQRSSTSRTQWRVTSSMLLLLPCCNTRRLRVHIGTHHHSMPQLCHSLYRTIKGKRKAQRITPAAVHPGHEGVDVCAAALASNDGAPCWVGHRHLTACLSHWVHYCAVRKVPTGLERLQSGRVAGWQSTREGQV